MKKTILCLVVGLCLVFSAATAQATTISVWSSPDNADALFELVHNFMQDNPDITIEVTPLSWAVLYASILRDITSGVGSFDVATWDLMTAGSIAPGFIDLDEFAAENPELVDPDFNDEDFIPVAHYVYGFWGEKRIGYPFYGANMYFFYRPDLFNDPQLQAAFEEQYTKELRVPENWQEAKDVAEFFTRSFNPDSPTEYGITLMFPRTHTLFYMFLNHFGPYRRSPEGIEKFGEVDLDWGDFFTSDQEPAFNSEEGIQAIQDMMDLMQYAPDPLGSDYGETMEVFSRGMAAMVPTWSAALASWQVSPDLQPPDEKIGIGIMPGGTPVSGGWGLGINAFSENKEEAFRFIQYATSFEGDKIQWLNYRVGPTRESVVYDSEVLADTPWVEEVYIPSLEGASHRPRIPEQPRLEDIFVGALSEILLGVRPNTIETLNEIAEEWNRVLAR